MKLSAITSHIVDAAYDVAPVPTMFVLTNVMVAKARRNAERDKSNSNRQAVKSK